MCAVDRLDVSSVLCFHRLRIANGLLVKTVLALKDYEIVLAIFFPIIAKK